MHHGKYWLSYVILRVCLGAVFLWIGLDIYRHPESWIGFVPTNLPLGLAPATALQLNAGLDAVIGILLVLGVFIRIAAALAALHLIGILVTQGIDAVLIRDVGLLGASLALLMWPKQNHKRWF